MNAIIAMLGCLGEGETLKLGIEKSDEDGSRGEFFYAATIHDAGDKCVVGISTAIDDPDSAESLIVNMLRNHRVRSAMKGAPT